MAVHLYRQGQIVSLSQSAAGGYRQGHFEVIRLLPASVDGEFHYRVRGPDKIERAVGESRLSPVRSA